MVNIKSAEKRNRQNAVRYARNHASISRIRTFIKKVEKAITSGNKDEAKEAFILAQPEMHRGINKKLLNKNTVARKLSRLNTRIKALS